MPKFSKKIKGEDRHERIDSSGLTRAEREDLASEEEKRQAAREESDHQRAPHHLGSGQADDDR